jgi:hypothetical protein
MTKQTLKKAVAKSISAKLSIGIEPEQIEYAGDDDAE